MISVKIVLFKKYKFSKRTQPLTFLSQWVSSAKHPDGLGTE